MAGECYLYSLLLGTCLPLSSFAAPNQLLQAFSQESTQVVFKKLTYLRFCVPLSSFSSSPISSLALHYHCLNYDNIFYQEHGLSFFSWKVTLP